MMELIFLDLTLKSWVILRLHLVVNKNAKKILLVLLLLSIWMLNTVGSKTNIQPNIHTQLQFLALKNAYLVCFLLKDNIASIIWITVSQSNLIISVQFKHYIKKHTCILSALCQTPHYTKSNGKIACGFYLPTLLNWFDANAKCTSLGARLPVIMSDKENTDIKNLQVDFLGYNDTFHHTKA